MNSNEEVLNYRFCDIILPVIYLIESDNDNVCSLFGSIEYIPERACIISIYRQPNFLCIIVFLVVTYSLSCLTIFI